VKIPHELSHRDRERQPVTNLAIVALAEALEQWPQRNEVFGCAADDTREVLVHGAMIDGVMVFSQPVHFDTFTSSRA
jgi:hypothetical protein